MNGKIIYSGFEFPADVHSTNLSNLTGGIKPGKKDFFLYSDAFSDEISEVSSNGNIINKYEFHFDFAWPKSDQYAFEKFVSSLNEGLFSFLGGKFLEAGDYLMFSYNLALSGKVKNFAPRKGYLNLNSHKVITQEYFPQDDIIQGLSGPLGTYKDFFISALYPNRLSDVEKVKGKLQKYGIDYEDENDNPLLFIHRVKLREASKIGIR